MNLLTLTPLPRTGGGGVIVRRVLPAAKARCLRPEFAGADLVTHAVRRHCTARLSVVRAGAGWATQRLGQVPDVTEFIPLPLQLP